MWCQKVSITATLKLFYADLFPLFHPQRRQNKQDIVSGKDSSWVAPAQLCGGLLINISGLKLIFNITNQNCSQASFLQIKWANNFFFFNPLYHLCVSSFQELPDLLKHTLQAETEKSVSLGHPCPTALGVGWEPLALSLAVWLTQRGGVDSP